MQKVNLMGVVFGRLEVVGEAPSVNGRGAWECRCVCGGTKIIRAAKLVSGEVKSCGCLRVDTSREHAKRKLSGGYKGYRKYKTVEDILANTTTNGDCKEWKGALHRNGYAKIGKTALFKTPLLHREVFNLVHGYYPPVVMHTCDNPRCINPAHLMGGTQQDNIDDMHRKGRGVKHNNVSETKENEDVGN